MYTSVGVVKLIAEMTESYSGTVYEGTVTNINKAQKHIRVALVIGERTFLFPYAFKQGFLRVK